MWLDSVDNNIHLAPTLLFRRIFKIDHQGNAITVENIPLRNVVVTDTRVVNLYERTDDLDPSNDVKLTVYKSKEVNIPEIVSQAREPRIDGLATVVKNETTSESFISVADEVSVAYRHPRILERLESTLVQRCLVPELPHRILAIRHLARDVRRVLDRLGQCPAVDLLPAALVQQFQSGDDEIGVGAAVRVGVAQGEPLVAIFF